MRERRRSWIRWAAAALVAVAPRVAMAAEPGPAVDLALVLAVDVSRSIDEEEANLQRSGYTMAFRDERVVRAIASGRHGRIAVAYFEWSDFRHNSMVVDWTVIADAAGANAFAQALAERPIAFGRRTSISGAIDFAMPILDRVPFQATRKVIDISGDGPNNDGRLVIKARDEAVARGFVINGLPIVNNKTTPFGWPGLPNLDLYYEDCVIGGPLAFVVVANTFKDFPTAVRKKLILEIAGLAPLRPAPGLLVPAQARERPPCDMGERQRRSYFDNP